MTDPPGNADAVARRQSDRRAIVAGIVVVVVFWSFAAVMILTHQAGTSVAVAAVVVAGYSTMSGYAAVATWRSRRSSAGREMTTWRNISVGLALWTAGGFAYIAYLVGGGDPTQPEVWSQIGYLAAYPPWYMALWQLRQPVLGSSRLQQIEIVLIELASLMMLALVIGSVLWSPKWPVGQNIAQLVPAILDVLLLATFYGAVRRSSWSSNTALTWFGYSFAGLALSDVLMTSFVSRGEVLIGGAASSGYVAAMVCLIIAARRPLRVAEVQNRVRGTTGTVAVGGLTLAGMAVVLAPDAFRPFAILGGAFLAWRLIAILNERDNSDSDALTGFLELRAFERHLGGVIQQSSKDRGALLVVIDLDGFGAWNARNGYSAGDWLLAEVAKALEGGGPGATAWGRLKADRFALTTISRGDADDRALAAHLQWVASRAATPLEARAGIVVLPRDAAGPAEALDAADEALRAASDNSRAVVAYGAGAMDGLAPIPGNASLARRIERIQGLIAEPEHIAIFLQPVVRLDDFSICGFEALSRFNLEPRRGPDEWIAEATHVGLGCDLEVQCALRAWSRRPDIPIPSHLAINLSPAAIMSETFEQAFLDEDLSELIVEVTEHERVSNYPRLAAKLAALRGRGARIAIDDMGAGHASLNHLIELKPDYIKLDRKLVTGVDLEPGKHALVRNMLHLAGDLGAHLIAEGIETDGELHALRELGVPLGQGYFLGRPTPDADGHVAYLSVAADRLRAPAAQAG